MDHSERFIASGNIFLQFDYIYDMCLGIASGLAEFTTLPADVVKVRLQVQQTPKIGAIVSPIQYNGFVDCVVKIIKNESPYSLWKGLTPALIRQVSYSAFSLVLYEPIRNIIAHGSPLDHCDNQTPNFVERFGAGGISGMVSMISLHASIINMLIDINRVLQLDRCHQDANTNIHP